MPAQLLWLVSLFTLNGHSPLSTFLTLFMGALSWWEAVLLTEMDKCLSLAPPRWPSVWFEFERLFTWRTTRIEWHKQTNFKYWNERVCRWFLQLLFPLRKGYSTFLEIKQQLYTSVTYVWRDCAPLTFAGQTVRRDPRQAVFADVAEGGPRVGAGVPVVHPWEMFHVELSRLTNKGKRKKDLMQKLPILRVKSGISS